MAVVVIVNLVRNITRNRVGWGACARLIEYSSKYQEIKYYFTRQPIVHIISPLHTAHKVLSWYSWYV